MDYFKEVFLHGNPPENCSVQNLVQISLVAPEINCPPVEKSAFEKNAFKVFLSFNNFIAIFLKKAFYLLPMVSSTLC